MNHDELKNYFSEIKSTKPKNNCPDCAIRVDTYLKSIEEWREELNRYKAAIKQIMPYLKKSTDMPDAVLAVMRTPIQQMQMAIEEMQKKDAAIENLRQLYWTNSTFVAQPVTQDQSKKHID